MTCTLRVRSRTQIAVSFAVPDNNTDFLVEFADRILICEICEKNFNSHNHLPLILPCFHAFCEVCVLTMLGKNSTLSCPLCHKFVSSEGSFPVDTIRKMMLTLIQAVYSLEGVPCASCCGPKQRALFRCQDCAEYLCEVCRIAHHKVNLTRTHIVVSLAEAAKSLTGLAQITENCEHHVRENLNLVCHTCDQPLCPVCVAHNDHRTADLKAVMPEKRQEVLALCDEIDSMQENIQNKIASVERILKATEVSHRAAIKDVRSLFGRLIQIIQDRELQVLETLEEMVSAKRSDIEKDLSNVKSLLVAAQNSADYARATVFLGSPSQVLAQKRHLKSEVKYLNDRSKIYLRNPPAFKMDGKELETLKESVGKLSVISVTRHNSTTSFTEEPDHTSHTVEMDSKTTDGTVIYSRPLDSPKRSSIKSSDGSNSPDPKGAVTQKSSASDIPRRKSTNFQEDPVVVLEEASADISHKSTRGHHSKQPNADHFENQGPVRYKISSKIALSNKPSKKRQTEKKEEAERYSSRYRSRSMSNDSLPGRYSEANNYVEPRIVVKTTGKYRSISRESLPRMSSPGDDGFTDRDVSSSGGPQSRRLSSPRESISRHRSSSRRPHAKHRSSSKGSVSRRHSSLSRNSLSGESVSRGSDSRHHSSSRRSVLRQRSSPGSSDSRYRSSSRGTVSDGFEATDSSHVIANVPTAESLQMKYADAGTDMTRCGLELDPVHCHPDCSDGT